MRVIRGSRRPPERPALRRGSKRAVSTGKPDSDCCDHRASRPLDESLFDEQLGDLHRVGGRALAQVVGADEQLEPVRLAEVLADAPDVRRVVADREHRHRVDVGRRVVEHLDPGRLLEQLARLLRGQLLLEGRVDRLRVAQEDRHAHAGGGHREGRVAQDLPGLVHHLHLFLRVAVVEEGIDVRQHVEGDAVREGLGFRLAGVHQVGDLLLELLDALLALARDRLVGRDDDAPELRGVVQRLEHDDHLDGRAVGVGDDAAVLRHRDRLGVHLGDDERDVVLHAEGAGVVDDDRPLPDCNGSEGLARTRPRTEEDDVDIGELALLRLLDCPCRSTEVNQFTDIIGGIERLEELDLDRGFLQHLHHLGPYGTHDPHYCNTV